MIKHLMVAESIAVSPSGEAYHLKIILLM